MSRSCIYVVYPSRDSYGYGPRQRHEASRRSGGSGAKHSSNDALRTWSMAAWRAAACRCLLWPAPSCSHWGHWRRCDLLLQDNDCIAVGGMGFNKVQQNHVWVCGYCILCSLEHILNIFKRMFAFSRTKRSGMDWHGLGVSGDCTALDCTYCTLPSLPSTFCLVILYYTCTGCQWRVRLLCHSLGRPWGDVKIVKCLRTPKKDPEMLEYLESMLEVHGRLKKDV